jgi:hypothetical protein
MPKIKQRVTVRSANEVRAIMLQYFYDRNRNATSMKGKNGSAVKISVIKKELKERYQLAQKEVLGNLWYLISQGWVVAEVEEKQVTGPNGTIIPSKSSYYRITAAGIDKMEGPGEFTMPKYQGININATGQNIITLGDGNKIDAQHTDLGAALVQLRNTITKSGVPESQKLALVADIDTIQSQLAKPQPSEGDRQCGLGACQVCRDHRRVRIIGEHDYPTDRGPIIVGCCWAVDGLR